MGYEIVVGDCRKILPTLKEEFFRCCITSPPYFGLRDYGSASQIGLEQTPEEYVAALVEVFQCVRRVLRADGTVWLNLGDSYASRKMSGIKPKDIIGIPWRVAFALQEDGWYLRQDIIWHKPNPMPESTKDRCTRAHEYLFMLTKNPVYYFDADSIRTPLQEVTKKRVQSGWSCDRANMSRRGAQGIHVDKMGARFAPDKGANKRSVWCIPAGHFKGAHFATFPVGLVEPCIKAGTAAGDWILDPFGGAGTTALAAERMGRNSVSCEANAAYAALALGRLNAEIGKILPSLFDNRRGSHDR